MKVPPSDPFAFQARVFDALCNDLFDVASGKSTGLQRTDALRQISRERACELNKPRSVNK
jgi:hypothetical protein